MIISGNALIGGQGVRGNGGSFFAVDPTLQQTIEPQISIVDQQQIGQACELADAAFESFSSLSNQARAAFLDTVVEEIEAIGDTLILRAMTESGLPRARLEGERGRTTGQLKLFATLLREGSWADLRIDSALPDRAPPRPELRMRKVGLGPVAVFAASNFPLAFSVAGGDTAAAFAAGCPVVVKAHSAHPGTSELVGQAIVRAVARSRLHAGVFALLTGSGNGIGQALVRHSAIKAVGFTGSRSGGLALMAVAAERPVPIPVYAEMSSINPVVLLPHAMKHRAEQIAQGFAASLTLGVGQFCTNPGLILARNDEHLTQFITTAKAALSQSNPATMLSPGIAESYQRGVAALTGHDDVETVLQKPNEAGKGGAALFLTNAEAFLSKHELGAEVFGPASLIVACQDDAQILAVIRSLEGQLTATIQMDDDDLPLAQKMLPDLERKVGRILVNGFPTGVEVSTAMVHGGPFPATSDGRSTSVGTAAIERFLRPICYQNFPAALLPESMQDDNVRDVWRRQDGTLSKLSHPSKGEAA